MKQSRPPFCECLTNPAKGASDRRQLRPPFAHLCYCYSCERISKPAWIENDEIEKLKERDE